METLEKRLIPFVRKLIIAGAIAAFFAVFAVFPRMGYFCEVDIVPEDVKKDPFGLWLMPVSCNMSYNPFLYPSSWLVGRGQLSIGFWMYSVPEYVGGEFPSLVWRSEADLEEEAILVLILNEMPMNVISNLLIFLGVELLKLRELYACLFGGVIGFPFGGPIGAFIGFFVGTFAVLFVWPKLKESGLSLEIWKTKEKTADTRSY